MIFRYKTLEETLKEIKERFDSKEAEIKYLEEENKKLKDEAYKDNELQEMKERLDKMQNDMWRGFPITEEEMAAIRAWMKKHEEEAHGLITDKQKLASQGVCGGKYTYHFIPTSIGTIGYVECGACGEKFTFQEMS